MDFDQFLKLLASLARLVHHDLEFDQLKTFIDAFMMPLYKEVAQQKHHDKEMQKDRIIEKVL